MPPDLRSRGHKNAENRCRNKQDIEGLKSKKEWSEKWEREDFIKDVDVIDHIVSFEIVILISG